MSARAAILAALGPAGELGAIEAEAAAFLTPSGLGDDGDLSLRFIEALAQPSIAATHERIDDLAALPRAVGRYLAANQLPPALTLAHPALAGDWSAFALAAQPPVDGGVVVTRAVAAVAETGSLVLETGPDMLMLANFLALHHVVAVDAAAIVARLEDIPHSAPVPRAHYWVTGVSGTTDIEGQYVRGAHGPRFLHVVVIG